MTREEAEKRKRRKKRLIKKRIRAIAVLLIIVAIIALAVVGLMKLARKNKSDSSSTPPVDSAQTSDIGQATPSQDQLQSPSPDAEPSPTAAAERPDSSVWSARLVNPANPLPSDFTIDVRTIKGTEKQYDVRAADSLEAMLSDAAAAGYKMYLVSTYRTVAYQQGLFDRKTNEYKNQGFDDETARAEAAKWVAIPGSSEHNLGLAADIVSSTWYNNNSDLTAEFENTEHFKWLIENCTKYGFILRYPNGKESVTGIAYEPWHYRYVGVEAATYIMENSLTLEEFHT